MIGSAGGVRELVRSIAGGLCARVLYALARDATEVGHRGRAMIVAPHADDETLGCGALIARRRNAGVDVTVVIASDGRRSSGDPEASDPSRVIETQREEVRRACTVLGVASDDLVLLDHRDGALADHDELLEKQIRELMRARLPD